MRDFWGWVTACQKSQRHSHTRMLFEGASDLIAGDEERNWTVKSPGAALGNSIVRFGCSGRRGEHFKWFGFDFDVGHGPNPYADSASAFKDAVAVARRAPGRAMVCTSSGGRGMHAFVIPEAGVPVGEKEAFITRCLDGLNVHPDPAPLKAQRFWLIDRREDAIRCELLLYFAGERVASFYREV